MGLFAVSSGWFYILQMPTVNEEGKADVDECGLGLCSNSSYNFTVQAPVRSH